MDHDDKTIFPEIFPEIGGKEFQWVWNNKKEFCEFTISEISKCTDFFLVWQNYCMRKQDKDAGVSKA